MEDVVGKGVGLGLTLASLLVLSTAYAIDFRSSLPRSKWWEPLVNIFIMVVPGFLLGLVFSLLAS